MRYTALIVGAAIIIVGTVFVTASIVETGAAAATAGPYQIAAQANTGNIWQLDTSTGALRICLPPVEWADPPECGAWGP